METTHRPDALVIYRCRACKRAGRPDAYRITFKRENSGRARIFTGPDGVRRVTHYADGVPGYPCPQADCGKENFAKAIRGTVTDEPCGAKCLAAKGPSCDCSCGGANHGSNHG
jgi:hypothetical protein